MAKMVKNLTVANIRNIEGMVRREDLDFADDGNRFRGFSYKGMPITTLRSDNVTYLSIRVDYLKNQFTYTEWMNTEEWKLCNEFNGVSEFDMDKLIENLEKVIAKVNELNRAAEAEVIDIQPIVEALTNEINKAQEAVDNFKTNFKWYDANESKLRLLARYMKSLESNIDRARRSLTGLIDYKIEVAQVRRFRESLEQYGYVVISKDSFYVKELTEALA